MFSFDELEVIHNLTLLLFVGIVSANTSHLELKSREAHVSGDVGFKTGVSF